MRRVSTIAAALAVVAVTVLGCSQVPTAEPTSASSTRTPAPATSTPVAPSVTDTPQDAAVAQPPVAFTGRIVCGDTVRTGVSESPADGGPVHLRTRGWAWQPTATMSDPRLEGDYYVSYDSDDYESPTVTSVGTGTWRIENREGAWQGSFTNIKYPESTTIVSTALVGEGAYEGLTAVWEATNHRPVECAWAIRGLILAGIVPAAPEPYTGEE
jgi:hypothetical protein